MRTERQGWSVKIAACALMLQATALLTGCGGGTGVSSPPPQLSTDQKAFESFELHGGTATLGWNFPYGGGNLVPGTNYFVSYAWSGLSQSPLTSGTQTEPIDAQSLDPNLSVPTASLARYLVGGNIVQRHNTASREVSYSGNSVQIAYLADDDSTPVYTLLLSNFTVVQLAGVMGSSPEEMLAAYPIENWIEANNFASNATWASGAAYFKHQSAYSADAYFVVDCSNTYPVVTTTGQSPTPCLQGGTLQDLFPITLFGSNGHPFEYDQLGDGTLTTIQGRNAWIANATVPEGQSATPVRRVFFEMAGNVYMGGLYLAGSAVATSQADGSVVPYVLGMNQAAVQSFQQGVITGAAVPGSEMGTATELSDTVDLFGIGGHAINGALSPADLRNHYVVPQGLDGTGQTIAIVDGPGTGNTADDLNVYSAAFGLPQCNATNPCFTQVYAPASNNPGTTSFDSGTEMALDTQMVHAMAPGASIVLVTANSLTFSDVASALVYAASLPGVTAVTLSASYWSTDVSGFQAQEPLLASIVANQGVILFASSGDNDTQFLNLGAPWPAGSASVTAVGGTRITSVASTVGANSEVAWTYSGGGWSLFASVPGWQSGYLSPTLVTANMGMKATPDVSAVADYQHSAVAVYHKERWLMSGGTSASSPIWAGISALLGQHLQAKQKSLATLIMATPGGFNGLLYQTSQTSGSTPGIVDITVGTNDLGSAPCSVCTATEGFDDVTGLGAPNVSNFISHF
jgi:hypothetical protein